MATKKLKNRPSAGDLRNSPPSKDHPNPRKIKGNATRSGEIFGKWHKPKLK